MKKAGIIILIIGLLMVLYSDLFYVSTEKVNDSEKLEMIKDNRYNVNWPLYVGIGTLLIGSIILVLGVNRKDEKEVLKK